MSSITESLRNFWLRDKMTATTIKIKVQATPNPDAIKFILDRSIKNEGKISFRSEYECLHVPLARALMQIPHVLQTHFFENVITVTQSGDMPEEELENAVKELITLFIDEHNPNFQSSEEVRRETLSPELQKIELILDETIRPALQADGGDVQVLELHNNILTIMYEGACGSCPSSQLGTLEAIRSTLRSEYDPEIDIVTL